jgi:hypothetical protein
MSNPKRSSLELLFANNPDAFLPMVAIFYSQQKSGQIPANMTYDEWNRKQIEASQSIMPLQQVTLKFDPSVKPIRVQSNSSSDPKTPVWKDDK